MNLSPEQLAAELMVVTNFDKATLTHSFNKHARDNIHSLKETSGKKAKKKGATDKKHSFLVHLSGSYYANIGTYNSFYNAWIIQDILTQLAKGE